MQVMHCWPTQWLEAAQRAGLAIYKGDGEWQFLNEGMRDFLAVFAKDIVGHAVSVERAECAKFAEEVTAYTQFQTVEHYKMAAFIAAAIRERSNGRIQGPAVGGGTPPEDGPLE